LQGQSQLYLPIYVNNDGEGNDQNSNAYDGGNDGFDIVILSLDSEDTEIGFGQETYVVKESWDVIADDAPRLNNFVVSSPEELNLYKTKTFLVDGNSRPFDTPQLVTGGSFRETTIIIEDAQSPTPIQLEAGDDVVPGSGIVDTSGVNIFYAGPGNDSIDSGASDDVARGENGDDRLLGSDGDDMLFGESGADVLRGGNSRSNNRPALGFSYRRPAGDYLNGGSGKDQLYGEGGLDRLDGMGGDDILYGDNENSSLDNPDIGDHRLNDEWDVINGGSGNDVLYGGADTDQLFGDDGIDYLNGGAGSDTLEGGAGADRFDLYGRGEEAQGLDTITDFDPSEDRIGIYVGGSIYTVSGLAINQAITAEQFHIGTVASNATHRFIYKNTGELFFDQDGTGAALQVRITQLSNAPDLNHTHIVTFDDMSRVPPPSPLAPLPPTVQFSQATYRVNENGGSSTITLSRSNRVNGVSQVLISVIGGTAQGNSDYDATGFPSTVTFGIGEISKTISIPIRQDVRSEKTESITLFLSSVNNPLVGTINVTIGSINTAKLEILDDDRPITLTGTARKDRLIGNELNNMIVGNGGDDILSGGSGNDRLFGGAGSDRFKGGRDRDVFALEFSVGRDLIQDFHDRQDKLGLTAGIKFNQLNLTQQGRNTLISFGGDQLALLRNVRSNSITRADFTSL
jgi:Ca2+-binding RTX toxin-like protein